MAEVRISKINKNGENHVWFEDDIIFSCNSHITVFVAVQTPLYIYIKFSSNLF